MRVFNGQKQLDNVTDHSIFIGRFSVFFSSILHSTNHYLCSGGTGCLIKIIFFYNPLAIILPLTFNKIYSLWNTICLNKFDIWLNITISDINNISIVYTSVQCIIVHINNIKINQQIQIAAT